MARSSPRPASKRWPTPPTTIFATIAPEPAVSCAIPTGSIRRGWPRSAHHLGEADDALDWALDALAVSRIAPDGEALTVDPAGIPRELQRRLLLAALIRLDVSPPRGPDLARAIDALEQGQTVTLGGMKLDGGPVWRIARAPPRRS